MPGKGSLYRVIGCWLLLVLGTMALVPTRAPAAEESRPMALQNLTTEDGLPQGTVYDTLHDSRGFIWLATEDGLIRYDGHDLVRYAYSRNKPDSLPGNFIREIVEDATGDLWLAVKDAGIARWSRATDTFTRFTHDPSDPNSLASNLARTLIIDRLGRIWIGLPDAGIDLLDPKSGRIQHLRHRPGDPTSLIDDRVNTLTVDRLGAIWAGTEAGLTRFANQELKGEQFSVDQGRVSQILEDRNGRLWVAFFDAGLAQIDRQGRILQRYRHKERRADSLAHDDVRALLEDRKGRLWIGTADGLELMNVSRGTFTHYRHRSDDAASLPDSFIMSLYEDNTGLVWIGTRAGGVSRWNPHSWEFGGHRPEWLAGALVTSFADAQDGQVWIGSIGGELTRLDPRSGISQSIDEVLGRRDALQGSRVMSLLLDRRGTLWIGTMNDGLKSLGSDGRIRSYPVGRNMPNAVSAPGLMTLYESRDGKIWIGTYGGGANVLDPASGTIRQLPFNSKARGALHGANVSAFAEDADGKLWIATDGSGLNLAQPDGQLLHLYKHDPSDPRSLSSNTLYSLAADGSGRIWVGTDGGGLDQVEGSSTQPEAIRFRNLSREQGLSSDTIYGVLTDAKGRLWLSGNAGLMRYDPRDRAIKTYHREHGLQGEEFNFNAYFRSRSGHLLFGGPGGFNVFDPARLTERTAPPRVALTDVQVLGVRVRPERPWALVNSVQLAADAKIVTFNFAVLDYTSPNRNRLAYRLKGLSERWIDIGSSRRITLTNLDAGSHELEVRAANADSVWSVQPLTLGIRKSAPWWQSPASYALYAAMLLALLLYRGWRQRQKFQTALAAQQRLESEVASRTKELRETNRLLEEAARVKEGFLARMSHELRTPMNGVIGMADLLDTTTLTTQQQRYTGTIRSSAQALLRILNDLLDISKINAGKIQLEAGPVDIAALLEECSLLFTGPCQRKNLQLQVRPPKNNLLLWGDALRVRQILMNLLGNAVKFTQMGSIHVRADIESQDSTRATVTIEIVDTGIGIDPRVIERIFEPFTQADETTSRHFGGTGLGLTICRELAHLMQGKIDVQSDLGKGTTFRFTLPLQVAVDQGAREARGARAAASSPSSLSGRILVVEDDPINATVADGYLRELGCSCVWVTDGPSAFSRVGAEPFDLIFMDLNMPGIDGFAATAALRQRMAGQKRIPIIALTAHDAGAYREKCLAADMDDILSKPYTLEECAAIVRRWLPQGGAAATEDVQPAPPSLESLAEIDAATVASIANLESPRQRDLYGRLVGLFEQSTAQRLEELGTALAANDLAAGAAICHKLKSAAANVGALAYSGVVRQAESECLGGHVAQASTLHRSLTLALPLLLARLRDQQMKVSA